jgi:Family of unknown function (DUF6356)
MPPLFTKHPASVGETYFAHLGSAGGFGSRMITAGLACLVHGIFPFLFQRTGSTRRAGALANCGRWMRLTRLINTIEVG